jgi:phage terminase small subunit
MDPITFTAIVAALSAGVATGAGKVVENALVDAYQGLKSTLKRKFGDDSEVVKAVDTVEEDPKSDWRQGMLKEMLERAGADQDPEVRKAAEELREQVKRQPGGEQHVQYARGNYIAQADRGSTAEVRVNQPKEE